MSASLGKGAPSSQATAGLRLKQHRAFSSIRPRLPVAVRASSGPDGGDKKQPEDLEQLKNKFFSAPGASSANRGSDPSSSPSQQPATDAEEDVVGSWTPSEDYVGRWLSPIEMGREARRALDRSGVDMAGVDSVNPYQLGAKARRAFDDVWSQLSQLSNPTKSRAVDFNLSPDRLEGDAEVPQAAYTTVLVVGATGKVGRILTRKLLLRGYKVRALVRRKEGRDGQTVEGVPAAVKLVYGDVGEMRDCQLAVQGVNKIIYCAGAKSSFTAELLRVEETGVRNMVKAFQDEVVRSSVGRSGKRAPGAKPRMFSDKSKKELADFSRPYHQERWDVTFVGVPKEEAKDLSDRSKEMAKYNQAFAEINDEDNLMFEGVLYQRGAIAEVGAEIQGTMPGGESRVSNTEGIVLRIRGDGKPYACVLKTAQGHSYIARFPTRMGYMHTRLPWTAFRDEKPSQPPLDPEQIRYMGIRYEFKKQERIARGSLTPEEVEEMKKDRQFELEVDWIKALPSGEEPDFVLVSRAGGQASGSAGPSAAAEMERMMMMAAEGDEAAAEAAVAGRQKAQLQSLESAKAVEFKRRGEELLRISGLGYTIVRPGNLVEEPGGYRALVFDQGDRITESVSAADVADICLRALHEPGARNKTFDVCYEYTSQAGMEMYEMVARVQDKNSSYLKAAVSNLAKNT